MPRTKKQKTWCPTDIMSGVRDAAWVIVGGNSIEGLQDGDYLLIDGTKKNPKDGDYVVWEPIPGKWSIYHYDSDYELQETIRGIGVAVVRKLKTKRRKPASGNKTEIANLRRQLAKLERLPENEAIQLQLESEIYRLESQTDDEWPEFVSA